MASKTERNVRPSQPMGAERPHGESAGDAPGTPSQSWISPSQNGGDRGYLAAFDATFRQSYPTLFDFLSLTGVAGAGRKTGTLLIFFEDARIKSCLNDRDGGYYAFLSSDTFTGLLEALDKALREGGLDWRQSKGFRR